MAPSLQCPITFEDFEEQGDNQPVMLACGHTISRVAVKGLIQAKRRTNGQVKCPTCQRVQPEVKSADDYPANWSLIELLRDTAEEEKRKRDKRKQRMKEEEAAKTTKEKQEAEDYKVALRLQKELNRMDGSHRHGHDKPADMKQQPAVPIPLAEIALLSGPSSSAAQTVTAATTPPQPTSPSQTPTPSTSTPDEPPRRVSWFGARLFQGRRITQPVEVSTPAPAPEPTPVEPVEEPLERQPTPHPSSTLLLDVNPNVHPPTYTPPSPSSVPLQTAHPVAAAPASPSAANQEAGAAAALIQPQQLQETATGVPEAPPAISMYSYVPLATTEPSNSASIPFAPAPPQPSSAAPQYYYLPSRHWAEANASETPAPSTPNPSNAAPSTALNSQPYSYGGGSIAYPVFTRPSPSTSSALQPDSSNPPEQTPSDSNISPQS